MQIANFSMILLLIINCTIRPKIMNQVSTEHQLSHSEHLPMATNQKINDYTIIRKLAISGQANLYLSIKKEVYYVLKIYTNNSKDSRFYDKEVDILHKLNGRGIVPIEESIQNIEFVNEHLQKIVGNVIVMPYYQNGDLLDWIVRFRPFSQKSGRYYLKRLVSTFRFISEKEILHRDVKPQNILLDQNYEPVVLDFGLSTDSYQTYAGFVGSARYAAPEIIKQKQYTRKSQIYSLGMLFFFALTGSYPYSVAKINEVNYRLIFQKKYSVFWQNIEKKTKIVLSNSFKQLFIRMTCPDPSKRPELDDLLQFDWFKENEMTRNEYFEYMRQKKFDQSI